ncbi:MAG: aspartate/glutamate racemase family protein, partial [Candidatus Eiseniibacteriota bacterium]
EVERLAGRPVLSLVGCAVDEVQNRKWRRVGVIGMGYPKVYVDRLEKAGIAYETIEPATQSKLNRVFLTFMEGRLDPEGHRLAADAVAELQGRGVDGVILGCTELPLILPELEGKPGLLNPAQVLAERAIRRASATKPTEATESTKSTELGAVPAIGVR